MKFSWKIFLAILIFCSLLALVFSQVLFAFKQNPHISLETHFFSTINPFWKLPSESITNNFPVKIPISIDNPTDSELIPEGYITLWNTDGKQILNIGIRDENTNPPGFLTDIIAINPEQKAISPKNTETFEILWNGFGDSFFEKNLEMGGLGTPKIIFSTPSEIFQNPDNYNISIFEKIFAKKHELEIIVRTHLTSRNTETDNQTEQIPLDFTMKIPYYTLEKSLNTGIILNLGFIVIFILLLSYFLNREKKFIKKISQNDIKILEEEAKIAIEKAKNKEKKNKKTT